MRGEEKVYKETVTEKCSLTWMCIEQENIELVISAFCEIGTIHGTKGLHMQVQGQQKATETQSSRKGQRVWSGRQHNFNNVE